MTTTEPLSLEWASPGETASDFLKDNESFVKGIRGPVGSGKSVTCCIGIFMLACGQEPDGKKKRRSRWLVIRNTNPELKTTTIKTWREWFGDEWGKFMWSPPYTHHMNFPHPSGDGTTVEAEVIFLSLDRDDQIKKLLSLEVTGAWINEAREIPKNIVDAVTMRVGRFPPKRHGGPTWKGVLMDTNSPNETHWWPIMAGDVDPPEYLDERERNQLIRPTNWRFFSQPPAMFEVASEDGTKIDYYENPNAENAKNLDESYYRNLIGGKDRSWIWVYVLNRYQTLRSGRPVYSNFRREIHIAKEPLKYVPNVPVYVGLDFGRTPTAVFAQCFDDTRWRVIAELMGPDMSTRTFAKLLRLSLANQGLLRSEQTDDDEKLKPEFPLYFIGDPSGDNRPESDDTTSFLIMMNNGIPVVAANSNDPQVRIEAVQELLNGLINGSPRLVISPTCTQLIAGFEGQYQYRKIRSSMGDIYDERPLKNTVSHPHDALQYAVIGGGEGVKLIGDAMIEAKHAITTFDPLHRQRPRRHRSKRWNARRPNYL